jgi:hypothetical protein
VHNLFSNVDSNKKEVRLTFESHLFFVFYCSTRRAGGGGGAASPQMLQKRALGRFICPQGQTRKVVNVPELPFIGILGDDTGGIVRGNVCDGCAT